MNIYNQFLGLVMVSVLFVQAKAAEFDCPNSAAPVELQYGDTVNCSIELSGDSDVYAFEMTKGDRISVSATQPVVECLQNGIEKGFDPELIGFNPSSAQVGRGVASCPKGTNVEFTAQQSGIHTVSIQDTGTARNLTGTYQMQFQCVSGPCITQALIKRNECVANFDGTKLNVPYIQYGAEVYSVNFNLISPSFQFQLTDYSKK